VAFISPGVAVLSVVLALGCELCQDACQRKLSDCLETAQTTDERAVCRYYASACLNKCPTPLPQLSLARDE